MHEDLASELITDVTDVAVGPANEHDAVPVVERIQHQEAAVGVHPRALHCDGAIGTTDVWADLAELRPLTDHKSIGKDAFVIDLAANAGQSSVTCPAGQRRRGGGACQREQHIVIVAPTGYRSCARLVERMALRWFSS